ncbi:flagellar hook-length control protein FliK [Tardiphaga sp.]|jgi:chemotaxis protein MotD|uniref:flagellar hook-length control protein FliK n=1 Tax=Tardiphaga sp. TaxID=1926292 RepID=UPI0037DA2BCB
MKQADMLTAAFRQLASAKTGGKGGLANALHAKDGKEKAEHFREQMRQVAKEPSAAVTKVDKNASHVTTAATPVLEAAAILAELTGNAKPKPATSESVEKDEDGAKTADEGKQASPTAQDWRDPTAAIGAVMSRLDQAQQNGAQGEKSAAKTLAPQIDASSDQLPDPKDIVSATDIDSSEIDQPGSKRFTVTVEAADAKPTSIAKAVVREQETHFEPVQQVTTLQKIVDRMASDLPAVAAPEGAQATETPSHDAAKAAESRPVRMMTLELDPPNLGSVTIKMRLAGDSVEVHLTADRLETTQLLRQERGALTDAMQAAGYSFDIAAIDHTRTPDGSMNNGQSQSQQQQTSSDQRGSMQSSNGSQTDGGSSGRSSGDGQSGARQNRQDHDQSHASASERSQDQAGRNIRSSTVYL